MKKNKDKYMRKTQKTSIVGTGRTEQGTRGRALLSYVPSVVALVDDMKNVLAVNKVRKVLLEMLNFMMIFVAKCVSSVVVCLFVGLFVSWLVSLSAFCCIAVVVAIVVVQFCC